MKNLLAKLNFTKKELAVIGFLFITFAAGLILKYSGWKTPGDFNYTESDRQFDQQVKLSFEELEKSRMNNEQMQRTERIKNFADSLITQKDSPKEKKSLLPGRKININTALAGDLQLLPGIGEVTAERIIEYRELKGPFRKAEDLKKVKGIGDKKFEQLQQYITTE
jgi:competence protein ComEA